MTDVGATIDWFTENLHFKAFPFPDETPFVFAILQRENVEIAVSKSSEEFVKKTRAGLPNDHMDAYVRTSGVIELHKELAERIESISPLRKQPYGDIEFSIEDCNGYKIVFGGDVERDIA